MFGAVGKPGAVPFQSGTLSLLQALSVANLDLQNYTWAELSQVRVIRSHGASADFMIVDAAKILHGDALPFPLQPGDVVFVPPNGIGTWNQVIAALLPSLQTVSGVLNPFVAIAYLSAELIIRRRNLSRKLPAPLSGNSAYDTIDLSQIVLSLKRRAELIAAIVAATTLVALLQRSGATPQFTASGALYLGDAHAHAAPRRMMETG